MSDDSKSADPDLPTPEEAEREGEDNETDIPEEEEQAPDA